MSAPTPGVHLERPVVVVCALYVACLWSLLFTFEFLGPTFVHWGKGRTPTFWDTTNGINQFYQNTLECQIALATSADTSACLANSISMLATLSTQSTEPLTEFAGIAIDTWPSWILLAVVAFLNYSLNYLGLNTIQVWIITEIQNPAAVGATYPQHEVQLIKFVWILFEFTIYFMDVMLALTQVDILLISLFGYIVTSCALNPITMQGRRVMGEHVQNPAHVSTGGIMSEPMNDVRLAELQGAGANTVSLGPFV